MDPRTRDELVDSYLTAATQRRNERVRFGYDLTTATRRRNEWVRSQY
jgi:hypothetical protein